MRIDSGPKEQLDLLANHRHPSNFYSRDYGECLELIAAQYRCKSRPAGPTGDPLQQSSLCQTLAMYNPPHFAETRPEVLLPILRERGFGTLVACGSGGLDAAQVPMEIDPSGRIFRCHVARPNPLWKAIAESPSVLAIFLGVDHYISPNWYPSKAEHGSVVPTWNYEAIHVHGNARIFEEDQRLLAHLEALTDAHERPFAKAWKVGDAHADFIERQMRGIVGIEIHVERIEGKFKLGQNRSKDDRQGAIHQLDAIASPESTALAAAMRQPRNAK